MRFAAALALLCLFGTAQAQYFGKDLGALSELHHGVRGRVFAVDSRTLYIKDFTYDGEGPAAYFYVGTSKSISGSGTRLRDERGASAPLRRYRGEPVTLTLPEGTSLKDVKWFSVWCDEFSVNFGDVRIPRDLEYPRPAKVGALSGVHGVSSDNIVVVDAQTLLIPNFSYDGEAPDAKFWVGRGDKPSPQGIRIPDENGKETPLRRYDRKTIVLTLPGELTVFDIGYFSVWCEAFTVNFGHVTLPSTKLSNVPPSLKMLGVSPQSRNTALAQSVPRAPSRRPARPPARVDATTYRPRLRPGPQALLEATDDERIALHRRADNYQPARTQLIEQPVTGFPEARLTQEQIQQLYNQQQQQIEILQALLQQQKQQQTQQESDPRRQAYEEILQQYNQYKTPEPVQYTLLPYDGTAQYRTIVDPIQRSVDLDPNTGRSQ
ncbi:protein Skeletor, isoforms B/C isoform X4 [Plutella xylostella]|uniref:protein Skeletor, isoforms B/C isoform X4 n=1 Tax=Plutella xylostella TaxID=51655 RepID=UPI002032ABB7|nr:protein Skeletor, isoforms B/C isoform X4 [Plutella xylostella]